MLDHELSCSARVDTSHADLCAFSFAWWNSLSVFACIVLAESMNNSCAKHKYSEVSTCHTLPG